MHRRELPGYMSDNGMNITEAPIYQTVASDLSDMNVESYDMICFFSPSGVQSLFKNFPSYEQSHTRIAVFGPTTAKEAGGAGLKVDIEAPKPNMPSMTAAIDRFMRDLEE